MAGIGGLLGNPVLEQLLIYNVLGQLLAGPLAPFVTVATNAANQALPEVPLAPAELALAVIRNELDEATAATEASKSGINAARFHTLARITGDAPAPDLLAAALRRELIDGARFLEGVRQGRLRDEWADTVKAMAQADPSPVTALLAFLKGQTDQPTAEALYTRFGGNVEHFQLAYDVEGEGPSPLEAAEAARRGIIGWTGTGAGVVSFEQAVRESAYRNKWLSVFEALSVYLPPPRTITALHREGAISTAEATSLYEKAGLPANLVGAYLTSGSRTKTAKHRELTEATVLQLYRDQLIPRAEADTFLQALNYDAAEAAFILEAEDFRLAAQATQHAVARVHNLYVAHKIDVGIATGDLAAMGLDATRADALLTIWTHERAANVRTLTPAEVGSLAKRSIITEDEALARLEADGYSPDDAWLYLADHLGAAPTVARPGGP